MTASPGRTGGRWFEIARTLQEKAFWKSMPLAGLSMTYIASVVLSMLDNHQNKRWNGFGLDAAPSEAIEAWGSSDPASYLSLANAIHTTGTLPNDLLWIINLWAPGQVWAYLTSLWVTSGPGFISILVLIDSMLWFLVILRFRSAFSGLIGDGILCCALAVFVVFSDFRGHILGPIVLYSDGTTAALLILLIFELKNFWRRGTRIESILAGLRIGVLVSCSIYLRSQNQYIFYLIIAVMFMSFAWTVIIASLNYANDSRLKIEWLMFRLRAPKDLSQSRASRVALLSIVSTFTVLLTVAPYLSWKASTVGDLGWDIGGKYVLTSGDALVFPQNWLKNEQLAPWQSEGGGGWACRIEPGKCDEIHRIEDSSPKPWNLYDSEPISATTFREMSFETALKNPIHFLSDRIGFLMRYLLSDTALVRPIDAPNLMRVLHLMVSVATILTLLRLSRRTKQVDIRGFLTGLVFLTFVVVTPPMFINFEVRYLLALRTVMNILFFLGLGISIHLVLSFLWERRANVVTFAKLNSEE